MTATTNTTTSPSPANHPPEIYQKLHAYSFTSDPEFKLGLAVLLGQPGTPASDEQVARTDNLVTKAKCFYFSRKFTIQPPIDLNIYNAWLQSQSPSTAPESAEQTQKLAADTQAEKLTPTSNSDAANTSSSPSDPANGSKPEPEPEQPAYPSSFAHIVELITTGQPIPGIQQIPDTVLTGQETASVAQKRRKPWEKEEFSGGSERDGIAPQGFGGRALESTGTAMDSQHEERAV